MSDRLTLTIMDRSSSADTYPMRFVLISLLSSLFLLVGSATYSAGEQLSPKQLRKIPPGAVVEGSARKGGIQPDYLIDVDSPEFGPLWSFCKKLKGDTQKNTPQKVALILTEVRKIFANHHQYDDPVYRNLIKQYRDKGEAIPLSKYVVCGAGVCRENALIMHFALEKAGIPNHHVYLDIVERYADGRLLTGDHGFVVFEYNKERWIADSYFKHYNGYSFDELLENMGDLKVPTRKLFFAEYRAEPRAILKVHSFPRVTVLAESCPSFFQRLIPALEPTGSLGY